VLRRLAGVVVGVPEPSATAAFLAEGLGFSLVEGPGQIEVVCAGDYVDRSPQRAITIIGRSSLELVEVRFDLETSVEPGALAGAVKAHGGQLMGDDAGTLRFRDPSGIVAACRVAPEDDGAQLPPSAIRPRRLGHANLKVVDVPGTIGFWVGAMGMWLSETIGEELAFLRYGGEHHNLGVRGAAQTTLHHLGFEVPGWDAYRPVLDHLDAAGYGAEFGPGRHAVGRNMFTYLRDPSSGLRVELFCDMARVDEQEDPGTALIRWRAEDRMSRTLNVWGSAPPPASFLE
jgi:catechol 2,3-dioxygenase-like lactoylglutathione lyase family enzyme